MRNCTSECNVEGFVLGALAIRSRYDEATSLSVLAGHLERFRRSEVAREAVIRVLESLDDARIVTVVGSLVRPTECRVTLRQSARAEREFYELAEQFILGGVLLHFAPLLQVSAVRLAAYRLWPEKEVLSAIYPAAVAVRKRGDVACLDRTSDVDQWHFALPRDATLLA